MSEQLFFVYTPGAIARNGDPETSHIAAQSVDVRRTQRQVYEALLDMGEAHDEALFRFMHKRGIKITPSGCRTRRSELVALGLVEYTGRRATRATGRPTRIWRAVQDAAP